MLRTLRLLLLLTAAAATVAVGRNAASLRSQPVFASGKHRGVCYAHALARGRGYGSEASAQSLRRLCSIGVDWISLTPFGFQRGASETTMRRFGRTGMGESDESIIAAVEQAHALSVRVLLKPHIWLRLPDWPGSITHTTDEGWRAWFASYREFILHYAALATEARADALCIGNELERTTGHEREWRDIIGAVRSAYRGPLTYGATTAEVETIGFWDALDFIGVSAYYPLAPERTPERAQIVEAWRPVRERLAALARRTNRTIVFTEIGYRSADFGAWRHWEIGRDAPVNLETQARAYQAFFDAMWPAPWFGGAYWWKWFSHPAPGEAPNQFEPKGKPAEAVLKAYFSAR